MTNLHHILNLKVNTPVGFIVSLVLVFIVYFLCYLIVEALQVIEILRLINQKIASLQRDIDWCIETEKDCSEKKREELQSTRLSAQKQIYEIKHLIKHWRFKDAYDKAVSPNWID